MSSNNEEAKQDEGGEVDKKENKGDKEIEVINHHEIDSTAKVVEQLEVNKMKIEEPVPNDEIIEKKEDNDKKQKSGAESVVKIDQKQNPTEQVYCVKWINFNNKNVPIILQNENGPCPLLAIANILFLKQIIQFSSRIEVITSLNLIEYLGDALLRSKPTKMSEDQEMNFNENFSDALNLLHKLEFGLDVNVKFTGVNEFEYTRELNIFDMFNINIYHGWLIDPQMKEIFELVKNLSYNQLVEKIIYLKNTDSQIDVVHGMQIEEFLDSTQSQLTYHGLIELQQALTPNELAVFFRNNHFSTILKHNNQLYLLATDQGFLHKSKIVWETLSSIDGDIYYVNSDFCDVLDDNFTETSSKNVSNNPNVPLAETADFMLARSMQNEIDEDYANLLQEEEKRQVELEEKNQRSQAQRVPQQQPNVYQRQEERKKEKKDKCLVM